MLEIFICAISGALIGGLSIWFYYRKKFNDVLTELEDKKLIIKSIHEHADLIERSNVKKMVKEHNQKSIKSKVNKIEKTPKTVKTRKKNEK